MKTIRAKFECSNIQVTSRPANTNPGEEENPEGEYFSEVTTFNAVYGDGDENKNWSTWTPAGSLSMTIDNPSAQGFFKPGRKYYLDLTEVDVVGGEG